MITVIIHKSVGNETVGEMWHETFSFPEETTLQELLDKIDHHGEIIIPTRDKQHMKERMKYD